MFVVQGKLISEDVVKEAFVCDLHACKGACCWEGDYGAPLEEEELKIMDAIQDVIRPYLSEEGKAAIEKQGAYVYEEDAEEYATTLVNNGACAYMVYDEKGIAKCGIEQAWKDGKTEFKKPISCHLYPIRIRKNDLVDFEALNYDRWDICSAACTLGKELKMPVYKFLKEALTRKYGEDFYNELEALAKSQTE
ncbi:MAG: DUF3109 family protein [Saprospiraceae bacterium]|nr:DUF3109 family protein [Saprospiraceae bacterium]